MKNFLKTTLISIIFFNIVSFAKAGWEIVGPQNLNMDHEDTIASDNSMAIASDGTPYVAFIDLASGYSSSNKVNVRKYNGESWVGVGSNYGTGIASDQGATYCSIALNSQDIPYVFYTELNSGNVVVKKLEGTNWVSLGSSVGEGLAYKIVIYEDIIYVAYSDYNASWPNQTSVTVKKYNSSTVSWDMIGGAGNISGSSGSANASIAINPVTDQPWVIVRTAWEPENMISVMGFENGVWVYKGGENFVSGYITNSSLVFNSGGVPYITYQDANNFKVTVKVLKNNVWSNVGQEDFIYTEDSANSAMIALNSLNVPFVVYIDNINVAIQAFIAEMWVDIDSSNSNYQGSISYPQLAFNPVNDEPFIFITRSDSHQWPIVYRFDLTVIETPPSSPTGLSVI